MITLEEIKTVGEELGYSAFMVNNNTKVLLYMDSDISEACVLSTFENKGHGYFVNLMDFAYIDEEPPLGPEIRFGKYDKDDYIPFCMFSKEGLRKALIELKNKTTKVYKEFIALKKKKSISSDFV